jgi:hypothetical protein
VTHFVISAVFALIHLGSAKAARSWHHLALGYLLLCAARHSSRITVADARFNMLY